MIRICASVAVCLSVATAGAGDWPQILGPTRDGVAIGERIVDRLPERPKPLWSRPVGDGFAGVAVSGRTAVLFHRAGDAERVEALDARTGEASWTSDAPTTYSGAIVDDAGPRCVPVIADGKVVVFGAEGLLLCLELKSGKTLWSNPTRETFGVLEGYFGAGSTPVVEGGSVLVNVGGARKGAGVVAFDLATGDVKWTATGEQASYSSPVVTTVAGRRQAVVAARLNCVGLDPETGRVLWSFPFGARGPTVNASNPVIFGDRLFLTASYGVGAAFTELAADGATELWRDENLLASQYTTPIAHDGVLFGVDGRQDVGVASLRCIDPATRKVLWDEPGFGYATLILADGKLLAQKTDGTLVLARPDKTGYRELSRATLMEGTTRALPALSNGRYYLRNESTLACYVIDR